MTEYIINRRSEARAILADTNATESLRRLAWQFLKQWGIK